MAVNIEIDGKQIEAEEGSMLIQAADAAGIYIPRFCYHDKLSIAANCRMCLIEVEKAPKPMPACATPVAEGMKAFTKSETARQAQRGTMEFLLINHPLDCPICDQGGECDLQDLSVGYGGDVSRYQENKRVVPSKKIGPLITTEMTRCIHCTRCVRFGQEIAGIMELGAVGRGEHMRISTFIDRSVDSEMSGNVIDLCPVGALTSAPFRYSARSWEMQDHPSISPHDAVGSNITIQTRGHKVMRVLPRDNEAVNECWLSDRDRFSYEAVNSEDRLERPMIKHNGAWQEVEWDQALDFMVAGFRKIIKSKDAGQLGALASPTATLEEFFLLQKFMRGIGSNNIDHRLRQIEFGDDDIAPLFPWFGQSIRDFENVDAALLVGSNLRKEQPILGHRLRKAARKGAAIMALNPVDYEFTYDLAGKVTGLPGNLSSSLAAIAKVLSEKTGKSLPAGATGWTSVVTPTEEENRIASILLEKENAVVLFGPLMANTTIAPAARALAELVADLSGARFGNLPEANSVGGWLAGCVPHRGVAGAEVDAGRNARAMISEPLRGYLLFGVEPELDFSDGSRARTAMHAADFVAMVSAFKPCKRGTTANDYADVLLPMGTFTETAGTYINGEGKVQAFTGAVPPRGEARPGWKILRVLGSMMEVDGFDHVSIDDVRADMGFGDVPASARLKTWRIPEKAEPRLSELNRLTEVPIYVVDPLVRRAPALQATHDNPRPAARLNAAQAARIGVSNGERVTVRMVEGSAELDLVVDDRIPDGCVLVPQGYAETATLGACGPATVVKAS
jgi:NADH-quinone oxidoreductase subunit G